MGPFYTGSGACPNAVDPTGRSLGWSGVCGVGLSSTCSDSWEAGGQTCAGTLQSMRSEDLLLPFHVAFQRSQLLRRVIEAIRSPHSPAVQDPLIDELRTSDCSSLQPNSHPNVYPMIIGVPPKSFERERVGFGPSGVERCQMPVCPGLDGGRCGSGFRK